MEYKDFTPKALCIVNDCNDNNTGGRQGFRVGSLLGLPVTYVGVPKFDELAAAGNIVDMLDAAGNEQSILMANVAPRFGGAQKFKNGVPFGYFWYKNTLVITTVSDTILSLVSKLGLVKQVHVLNMETSVPVFVEHGMICQDTASSILNTQFRSFNFTPRVAQFIATYKKDLPGESLRLKEYQPSPSIWWIDNFGNCKTTVTLEDVDWKAGEKISFLETTFTMYDRLKDVPDGEVALIVGSSGIEGKRFLELVIQGQSAAEKLGFSVGQSL